MGLGRPKHETLIAQGNKGLMFSFLDTTIGFDTTIGVVFNLKAFIDERIENAFISPGKGPEGMLAFRRPDPTQVMKHLYRGIPA